MGRCALFFLAPTALLISASDAYCLDRLVLMACIPLKPIVDNGVTNLQKVQDQRKMVVDKIINALKKSIETNDELTKKHCPGANQSNLSKECVVLYDQLAYWERSLLKLKKEELDIQDAEAALIRQQLSEAQQEWNGLPGECKAAAAEPLPPQPTAAQPGPSSGSVASDFAWNGPRGVINAHGTVTGNTANWRFEGPAVMSGPLGANVTCKGARTAPADKPGAEGTMTCDITWGSPAHVWHCEGKGQFRVDWSEVAGGGAWFAISSRGNGCKGYITVGGKNDPPGEAKFGPIYLKSGP